VQPAICRADNVLVVRNFVSFHEFFQFRKQIEVSWSQDNALDHTSAQALAVIQNAGFELYSITHHIRYSYSYCMANSWLEDREQEFFYIGIRAFEKRWSKCISVAGDYIEK